MILGEYFTFTNNFLLLDYISFGEHDEEQILKLGPGATKALQILRSHSNTPMRLKGWLIISDRKDSDRLHRKDSDRLHRKDTDRSRRKLYW